MKNKIKLLFVVSLFWACSDTKETVVIKNLGDAPVTHKEVIVSREQTEAPPNRLPVFYDSNQQNVPAQLRDIDGDNHWDQVFVQVSLQPMDSVLFEIEWVDSANYPTYEKQTQAYFGYDEERNNQYISLAQHVRPEGHEPQDPPYMYQFEGPGWENNLVGFRSYFDTRNGKDIFGKTTEKMILTEIALGENYHELQPWGMDILKVGSSLGAGSLAIAKGDTLIRLGPTGYSEFVKVDEGPLFSTLKLIYRDWDINGELYTIEEKITIWANKRWYNSEIILPGHEQDTLVAGIVNLNNADVDSVSSNDFEVLLTHGVQSENKDALGMAIIVPENGQVAFSKASNFSSDVSDSELALLKSFEGKFSFYFYAGWEEEDRGFSNVDYFKSQLQKAAQELNVSLEVDVN